MDDNNPMREMLPFEKEAMFAEELESLISRFCQEYNMTYAQIIGLLYIKACEVVSEGFEEPENEP